jgi:replicative DNA helicase
VFTPNDAVAGALKTIAERRTNAGVGVRLGVPDVDQYMIPARPGELITVMGMTSNFKSGLMQFWARHTADVIGEEHIEDECVVYVTWEQAIEEMLTFDLAATARLSATDIMQGRITDAQFDELRLVHGTRRAMAPLYLIGHSLAEGKKRPRLTLDVVGRALMLIREEFGLKPRAIFLDYLQQIDPGEGENRRMQVFHNVDRCKDMSLGMACPVVLGCQASRSLYGETWGVPRMHDGLETSNIEHTTDKMLGVWMPKTSHEIGKVLSAQGKQIEVTENLLILKLNKQKMGPAGRWWCLYVDPSRNEVRGMADVALND